MCRPVYMTEFSYDGSIVFDEHESVPAFKHHCIFMIKLGVVRIESWH